MYRAYADDTSLTTADGPFGGQYVKARALCSDGIVRNVRFTDGIADTFFSVPGRVSVKGKTVSGYVTIETREGFSTETPDDPSVVKFRAYRYGKNGHLLP